MSGEIPWEERRGLCVCGGENDVFSLKCLVSGASGVSTYGCLVGYGIYVGFRTPETDVG